MLVSFFVTDRFMTPVDTNVYFHNFILFVCFNYYLSSNVFKWLLFKSSYIFIKGNYFSDYLIHILIIFNYTYLIPFSYIIHTESDPVDYWKQILVG